MKFFLDTTKKQLVKSAASNVALDRLVLKRRDSLAVEVAFVARGALASMPSGTTTTVALKKTFADSNFLALASGEPPTLNLNTVPLEASFSSNPASVSALLEIRWSVPGETTRTATLAVEIQNSVILGTEQTPEALPDGKATQAEAEAGTDNAKWMTPRRTAQAIAELAPPPTWDSVTGKPATFAPSDHTHTASDITDFASAVVAVSPPVDWSSLTGKPATFAPATHTHPATAITGLSDFIIASAPGLSITTTTHTADGLTDTYSVGGLASADPSAVLVSLNGVTQNPTIDYTVSLATGSIVFDGYPAAGTQIVFTALGLRSVQPPIDPTLYVYAFDLSANGLTTYSGRLLNADRPAAPALPETASTWTIRRSTLNAAGRVLNNAQATGSWLNRETLAFQ